MERIENIKIHPEHSNVIIVKESDGSKISYLMTEGKTMSPGQVWITMWRSYQVAWFQPLARGEFPTILEISKP